MGGSALSFAGSKQQAYASRMAGEERAMAAQYEGEQLQRQGEMFKTAASQDETSRRKELTGAIGTIMAIQAGRGVGLGSPTSTAITADMIGDAESDIATSKLNILSRADQSRTGGELAVRRARYSLLAGELGAKAAEIGGFADLISGFGKAASLGIKSSSSKA